jgi:hypothetical protein
MLKWEESIRINLKEIMHECLYWIQDNSSGVLFNTIMELYHLGREFLVKLSYYEFLKKESALLRINWQSWFSGY